MITVKRDCLDYACTKQPEGLDRYMHTQNEMTMAEAGQVHVSGPPEGGWHTHLLQFEQHLFYLRQQGIMLYNRKVPRRKIDSRIC